MTVIFSICPAKEKPEIQLVNLTPVLITIRPFWFGFLNFIKNSKNKKKKGEKIIKKWRESKRISLTKNKERKCYQVDFFFSFILV